METKGLLKVGVIGCGNFGGQSANALIEENFPCIAVNASEKDLSLLDEQIQCYMVGDGMGTGKNRDLAKNFFADHINIVKDQIFADIISENDVIVIIGSAGGGFGSGCVPALANVLMTVYPDDCFKILTTLPSISETYEAQRHLEEFMSEILSLGIPYHILDNDKFTNLEASEMNDKVIAEVVETMKIIRGDYIFDTTTGGIDHRDLMTLNSTPGRSVTCLINDLEISKIVDNSLVKTLKTAISKSANAVVVDDKVIDGSGIMYNLVGSELINLGAKVSTEIQEEFGTHIADFRNEVVDSDETDSFIACFLAGLTTPTTRIDKAINRRISIEDTITSRKAASTKLHNVQPGKLSLSAKQFGSKPSSSPATNKSIDELLKKLSSATAASVNTIINDDDKKTGEADK